MSTATQHRRLVVAAVLVAVCSLSGAFGFGRLAPAVPVTIPVPGTAQPPSAERGRRLFVMSCSHCHGMDAHGDGEDGDGPDLASLRIGNARIATVIHGGIRDEMPSFAKKHNAADIADITAYLRTVR